MTDNDKREALLKLATLVGLPDPETIPRSSLSYVVQYTQEEMLNQFYKYKPDYLAEDEAQNRKGIWVYADQYGALEEAEEGGKIPDAGDIAKYAYDALTSLSYQDCVFLHGLYHSDDRELSDMAQMTFELSVRAAINSLLRRMNYHFTTEENSREIRADGILEAIECVTTYNPTSGPQTTFFTYSYKKLWAALLASMNGYDKHDDQARHFFSRAGKVTKAIGYFESRGNTNPTDIQLAAYINQNTSKKQQISPESVKEARRSLPNKMLTYLDEFQAGNLTNANDDTETVETQTSIQMALEHMPQEQADIIRIIVYLYEHGMQCPGWQDLAPLIRERFKDRELSDVDIRSMVQKAREAFKADFFGSDYTAPETANPLLDSILVTEDYTDDMLNILNNNDPSDIFS